MSQALPTRGLRFTVGDQPIRCGAYVTIGPGDGKVYPWSGAPDHGTAGDYLRPGEQVEVDHRGLLVPVAVPAAAPSVEQLDREALALNLELVLGAAEEWAGEYRHSRVEQERAHRVLSAVHSLRARTHVQE